MSTAFTRAVERGALFLALGGCGRGTTAPSPQNPSGNYAGVFDGGTVTLAIHLTANGGVLSGGGWSTILPSLMTGGTISGTYADRELHFDLRPPPPALSWHFDGVVESDTLRGDFALAPGQGFLVELPRVDTVPTGLATVTLSGGVDLSAAGAAIFAYPPPSFEAALVVDAPGAPSFQVRVVWGRSGPLAVGTYPLHSGGGATPTVAFIRSAPGSDAVTLPLTSGTLVVEASNRFAMIGRLDLVVADSQIAQPIAVHAVFSAGCTFNC
ncbi:MAG: hypothetical protein ABI647_19735 [Gemmatimonadota bacterium]